MESSKRKCKAAELSGALTHVGAGLLLVVWTKNVAAASVRKNMKIGEAPNFIILTFLELNIGANNGNVLNFLY